MDANERTQYLAFRIAGADCAIPIQRIREIVECGAVTRVPQAPPCVSGVTNLRGSVIPVIDLAVKFGLAPTGVTRWTCIVVVELPFRGAQTTMGVLADSVTEVMDLGADDVEAPPAFGTAVRTDYLTGLAKLGDRFILLLDVERLLSPSELTTTLELPDMAKLGGPRAVETRSEGKAEAGPR